MVFGAPITVDINTGGVDSFSFSDGDFAFLLAHEVGHVMQATDGNYTQPRATRGFLRQFRSSRSFGMVSSQARTFTRA